MSEPLTTVERAILVHVSEDDRRDGWCRWSYQPGVWPWEWNDYLPLVERGLLQRKEGWGDLMLKITPWGWMALNAAPDDVLSEPRSNVRGQAFDGDLLPDSRASDEKRGA